MIQGAKVCPRVLLSRSVSKEIDKKKVHETYLHAVVLVLA